MEDRDLRGELLAIFYELRNNAGGWVPTSETNVRDGAASRGAVASVCQQMADAGLIEWQPFTAAEEGVIIGKARITGHGVDVVTGTRAAKIDVRMKRVDSLEIQPCIQTDAMSLLAAINHAAKGSDNPVVLDDLESLPMGLDRTKAAFQYLKSKGLIEANFSIFYAARLSAAGHDAILETQGPAEIATPVAESERELLTLKPGIWGMSIDLKEAWRRVRHRCNKA